MGETGIPTVSVIVPNYNHARFLRQRIDSIFAQTYQDFELILLDDCSTDESREILRSYASDARVRLEFNETNSGTPFKQWNKGVRLARGEYVWIAESDDYAESRFLERMVQALQPELAVAFAYCRSRCVREDGAFEGLADYYLGKLNAKRWASDFVVDGTEICREYFARTNPVPNASAVVFRRDIYESVGGADESLRLCGDWKLWAAMALRGRIGYIAEPLNHFRHHGASVRRQTELAKSEVPEYLMVTRWVLDHVTVSAELLETICEDKAQIWVPAVMSLKVPLPLKQKILRHARAIDPHPFRRAVGPAVRTVGLKVQRHWREMVG